MAKRRRRIAFIFIALAGSALVSVLLAELVVRALVAPALWRFRDSAADWVPDARLGWVQKGNLDVETRAEAGWVVRFSTNSDGLTPASARREKKEGIFRILLVGDSTVVGRNVPQDSTVGAFLERELDRRGVRAEALNAGVEGYSTDQALIRLEELLPLYRPDLALLGVCDNDLAGNSAGEAYGMPKPRFLLRGDQLVEVPPAGSWEPQRAAQFRAWIQYSALYRLAHPWIFEMRARLGGWRERALLGLSPEIYYDRQALERFDWSLFEAILSRMNSTAAAHGAEFAFYPHPALAEVWDPFVDNTLERLKIEPARYDRYALENKYAAMDVQFVRLIDRFRAAADQGPFHLLPRDPHCNPVGYRITAQALAEYVVEHID